MSFDNFISGGGLGPWADLGPTNVQKEGTYRRGYHQAGDVSRNPRNFRHPSWTRMAGCLLENRQWWRSMIL